MFSAGDFGQGRTHMVDTGVITPVHSKQVLRKQLEQAIQSGRLPPGARLMTEREIALGSGLARSTVRGVLADLESSGLIERRVGRGTFVSGGASEVMAPVPSPRFRPAELIEFRQAFEPSLAELVVLKASEAELSVIRDLAIAGRGVSDWLDCEDLDSAFHARIYEATHNAMVAGVGAELQRARLEPAWRRIKEANFSIESWPLYQAEHEGIAEALIHRDARQARDLLRRHLLDVRANWVI